MIEKMKFLSITGPKADIDRVVNQYLSKYEIHLENALSELKTVEELRPFMEINPYKELLNKANEFVSQLSQPVSEETGRVSVAEEGMLTKIADAEGLKKILSTVKEESVSLKSTRNSFPLCSGSSRS